jgi:rare lipoprotein A
VRVRATRPLPRSLPIALAALLLAACASAPKHPGFYREDGPPERIPPDLLATPDAVPREEPLNPNANRAYVAMGRTYVPDTSDSPFHQHGIASWYGRQFQGNRTASGEPYDMFAMTAAHPTLPIPSYARVTNVRDGRSVIVRINDRGPFMHDRIIDLSYVAAARLGLAGAGSGEVDVDRIVPGTIALAPPPAAVALAVTPPGSESVASVPLTGQTPDPPAAAAGSRWSVQLGAFKIATNAEALRDRLGVLLSSPEAASLPAELRSARIERRGELSHVVIGDASERAVALHWSQLLEQFLARPTALFAH